MSQAWYALRRTIVPWEFSRQAEELLEVLPVIGADELVLKIDTEEFTHGQPNFEWVKKYCRKLKTFKNEIEDKGIVFSLNPWITVGHNDRGRDGSLNISGIKTLVDQRGIKCSCCACPLSRKWQQHVKKVWSEYARLQPSVIWLEDDLRTFNHRPAEVSCFCSLHLAEFSRRIGKKVSREELVSAISKPGKPHWFRTKYLEMQRDVILNMVKMIVETVKAVSPEARFGLMSSGPRCHCMEGRDWERLAAILSTDYPMISRPPLGSYNEVSLRGLYYSSDSIKLTRHVLPEGVTEQTEVENFPFSQYSKSINFTFLQMAISFALGCHGVTMNLFDHCGSAMASEPDMLAMLANSKKYLNALADETQGLGRQRGIQLLFSTEYSYKKQLESGDDYKLAPEDECLPETLDSLGLPTTYSNEKVRSAIGQSIRCFSDKEIKAFLADGLFIDAIAAEILVKRGFGEHIGIGKIETPVCIDSLEPLSAEEYHNSAFGGQKGRMLTLTLKTRPTYSLASISSKAKIISDLVSPDVDRKYPAMFAVENSLGGRVVVHLLDWKTSCGVGFNSPYRREQMHSVMQWLSRDKLAASVEHVYPLLIRRDMKSQSVLSLFNLSLDEYPSTSIKIFDQRKIEDIYLLSNGGCWRKGRSLILKSNGGHHTIFYDKHLCFTRPLVIRIKFNANK